MAITIDEAIRVNTVLKGAPVLKDDPKIIATLNLNIEALKLIQRERLLWVNPVEKILPGETEE